MNHRIVGGFVLALALAQGHASELREDARISIAARSDTPVQKQALAQMALSLQDAMAVDVSNEAQRLVVVRAISAGVACLYARYPIEESSQKVNDMRELMVDTKARSQAYARFNRAADGTTIRATKGDGCAGP